ncbi:hybrid sensor histidine kinase/response regulator [Desertivirga xinjiangensis]|uniref:hybrid sensor histidine kinase/response regulator n=1 Tax=Desertivirga xinjiangensis TaxID=539206 RepID=UPI00210EB3E0|nr:hybrid sensor histidine kinase/response regulator [Pedobacter xinjiangensis]
MSVVKILLIDDDEDDFILTRELLYESTNRYQYELSWCNNYGEAIALMLRSEHDLFLVDYRLGESSGIDLLNEAVKSNCTKPIIILTGKGDRKIDDEALRFGAADYLVKDEINSRSLERAIRYAFEHHKTLKKLKDSENKFRIIFERSKDPMLITDFEGNIFEGNPAAFEFFGLGKETFLTKNATELYKDKATRTRFTCSMGEKGSVTDMECEFVDSKGNVKYGSLTSFLQITQHGNNELYYSMIRDLTQQKLNERQLPPEQKLYAIERISKNLALEFYDPLSNIILAIDELKISIGNPEELMLLDIIKRNCNKIDQFTLQLIKSTEPPLVNLKRTNLNDLLHACTAQAESRYDIEVEVFFMNDGPVWINADEDKLGYVIHQLLKNAVEATVGPCRVSLKVEESEGKLIVEVSDNGEGISEENLSKVFEPFFSTKPRSLGIGLTQVRRIIDAHKGSISIQNNEPTGTNILITLPV